MSTSQTVSKRSRHDAVTLSQPPTKRIKRPTRILSEDQYTAALSHIIARDFFPGLAESETQKNYLDSYHDPIAFDTKQNGTEEKTTVSPFVHSSIQVSRQPFKTDISLGEFQASYTSEDNESFYKLLDRQNQKRSNLRSRTSGWEQVAAPRRIRGAGGSPEWLQSSTSVDDIEREGPVHDQSDTKKAMPDTWKPDHQNNLMFNPSSIEFAVNTIQQRAEDASRAAPKVVAYHNTRLSASRDNLSNQAPPSPSLSAIRDAISGLARRAPSEVGSFLLETPRVNGYAFVDSEPDPKSEGHQRDPDAKGSTRTPDSTSNPFIIKENSNREALHHRMVDKVAKGKRLPKTHADSKTPTPQFGSGPRPGKGDLTPAARKLLGKFEVMTPGVGPWEGNKTPRPKSLLAKKSSTQAK